MKNKLLVKFKDIKKINKKNIFNSLGMKDEIFNSLEAIDETS